MPRLSVHYLPQFVPESDLADSAVVVIDQLRASSTICHALSAGAKCIVPLVEVEEVRQQAGSYLEASVLLGGERGGRRIEGFDLGNSPTEYTPEKVFGKTVLFSTTNGARAVAHARLAQRILIGSTSNRQAVVRALVDEPAIDILCAGTNGSVTREDILAAGSIVDGLLSLPDSEWETNEWVDPANGEWQELLATASAWGRSVSSQLNLELRETQGGKNLLAIGHDFDLEICAQVDTLDLVPEFDPDSAAIVA